MSQDNNQPAEMGGARPAGAGDAPPPPRTEIDDGPYWHQGQAPVAQAVRPERASAERADEYEEVGARRGTGATRGLATDYRILQKIDPWSVMKLGFLVSIAIGIMMVIAAALAWLLLDSFQVFSSITEIIGEVDTSSGEFSKLLSYLHFDKVISMATIVAIANTVLLTILMTIGAFLYNIVAALVGGVHVTLVED